MSNPGSNRHSWQLKTSIDPRRPFDAELLSTLQEIQHSQHISQSRAIMHLLWYGYRAYKKPALLQEASPQQHPVAAPAPRPSRRLRASKPVQPGSSPRRTSASADRVTSRPHSAQPLSVSPTLAVLQESPQVDQMSLPDQAPAACHQLPASAAGLLKLRTMALSRSVSLPDPPPRSSANAIEAQALVPAVAANRLARLKNDGRQI